MGTNLYLECRTNNTNRVEQLLKETKVVNDLQLRSVEKMSLLHYAVADGFKGICYLLLSFASTYQIMVERGVPFIEAKDVTHRTFLQLAMVTTLLHHAVKQGAFDRIRFLVSHNADVNAHCTRSNDITPLHIAVHRRSDTLVK